MKRKSKRRIGLSGKLRKIILSMSVPLGCLIGLMLILLGFYSIKYTKITHNVTISSRFSLDFKENIDLKMYHFAVGSKEQQTLPTNDVEDAIEIAQSLIRTTSRKESRQAINNMIDYCHNLEDKMYQIQNTKDYDSRQVQLNNNIYVLTNLIQKSMTDYIYYEAGYMASLEQAMNKNIRYIFMISVFLITVTFTLLLYRSFRFTASITKPIRQLCHNVSRVGHGDFEIPIIQADYFEIVELDAGIQKMAKRIRRLLDNVVKEEKLQHKTQLQLLQSQINPHFLYNTLDTIVWLVECEKNEGAVEMLTNLSVFFRTTLSKGKDVITLKDEVDHTRSYLEIQQIRYRDILEYTIDLPSELACVSVPKLTLQPLAENAIYHGVKEKRGKSVIHISCKRVGEDKIKLIVSDNGIGMKEERLQQVQKAIQSGERIGFGLAAVHDRMKLYFGEGYGISVQSEYGLGTTVEVLISEKIQLLE